MIPSLVLNSTLWGWIENGIDVDVDVGVPVGVWEAVGGGVVLIRVGERAVSVLTKEGEGV